jgi:hypothetical protein
MPNIYPIHLILFFNLFILEYTTISYYNCKLTRPTSLITGMTETGIAVLWIIEFYAVWNDMKSNKQYTTCCS